MAAPGTPVISSTPLTTWLGLVVLSGRKGWPPSSETRSWEPFQPSQCCASRKATAAWQLTHADSATAFDQVRPPSLVWLRYIVGAPDDTSIGSTPWLASNMIGGLS